MSWINFLREMADDFDLSPEQTQVFIIRFDEKNKQKAEKEMEKLFLENLGLDKPAYVKRRQGIYGKFTWGKQKPKGCRELINAGSHKAEKLRKWLESKYNEQQVIEESDSHSSTATVVGEIARDWRGKFRSLIDIKTEGFVGRKYVFDKIEDFLSNKPNGYFTIEGDPGLGKSTILAEYVRRHECVAHFNDRLGSPNRTSQFLESVCTQLIAKYRLPYSELPPDANQNNTFLGKLLLEISEQLKPGERLVIVVDALDEVDPDSQEKSKNILYLPRYLPKNVYFVMSRRRGVDLLFGVETPKHLFDLMAEEYADLSLQDVRAYIRQHVNEHERLRQWIEGNGLTVEDFITQLADKSENNFMYLRCVLVEIEDGIYQDASIESLPQGLEAYYEDHWQHMGMTIEPLPRPKIKIVYVLAELREPVSRQTIASFAREDVSIVQEVLDGWRQFLHDEAADGQTRYSVYHSSFSDFLYRKDIVQAVGETIIQDINTLIVDDLTGGIGDE